MLTDWDKKRRMEFNKSRAHAKRALSKLQQEKNKLWQDLEEQKKKEQWIRKKYFAAMKACELGELRVAETEAACKQLAMELEGKTSATGVTPTNAGEKTPEPANVAATPFQRAGKDEEENVAVNAGASETPQVTATQNLPGKTLLPTLATTTVVTPTKLDMNSSGAKTVQGKTLVPSGTSATTIMVTPSKKNSKRVANVELVGKKESKRDKCLFDEADKLNNKEDKSEGDAKESEEEYGEK